MSSYFESIRLLMIYDAIGQPGVILPTENMIEKEAKSHNLQNGARTQSSYGSGEEDEHMNISLKKKRIKTNLAECKKKKRSLSIDSEIDLPPATTPKIQHDYLSKYNTSEKKVSNPIPPVSLQQLAFASSTESALSNVSSVISSQTTRFLNSQINDATAASARAISIAIDSKNQQHINNIKLRYLKASRRSQIASKVESVETPKLINGTPLKHGKKEVCELCGSLFKGPKSTIYKQQHKRRVHKQAKNNRVKLEFSQGDTTSLKEDNFGLESIPSTTSTLVPIE